jgi:hypothetical protein
VLHEDAQIVELNTEGLVSVEGFSHNGGERRRHEGLWNVVCMRSGTGVAVTYMIADQATAQSANPLERHSWDR